MTALAMVIFSHMRSRISKPESGSCMARTTTPMSLFTVSAASSSSARHSPTSAGVGGGLRAATRLPATPPRGWVTTARPPPDETQGWGAEGAGVTLVSFPNRTLGPNHGEAAPPTAQSL